MDAYYISICIHCSFRENLDLLSLHIAEDDGEVDSDFPALENKEPISKFDFAKLALMQNATPQNSSVSRYNVMM